MIEERRKDYPDILKQLNTIETNIAVLESYVKNHLEHITERLDKHGRENRELGIKVNKVLFENGLVNQVKHNTNDIRKIVNNNKITYHRVLDYAFKIGLSIFVWYLATKK